VDAALADRLGSLGDAGVAREARALAYQLDPAATLRRSRGARADRHVSLRPAPDTMTYLTGFLPVEQGVAVHAALTRHADTLRAGGDRRSRGQIMADTLVERVTGQAEAPAVPVEIQLLMTDRTLLGRDDIPARLHGHGPLPAAVARSLLRSTAAAATPARAWVRRLYTSPTTGELVAMDSRRRLFPGPLRRFLVLRDEVCRTPWCDAPIRHADHVVRAADGGETSAENGQGLCERCNLAKEAPGWSASRSRRRAGPGQSPARPRHTVEITTPTGHAYTSRAPDPPGLRPREVVRSPRVAGARASAIEQRFIRLLTAQATGITRTRAG
jgi:5-methylcytosine-specific restriction endonuclease McrA